MSFSTIGGLPRVQEIDLRLLRVDAYDLVSESCETRGDDRADIAKSDYTDLHPCSCSSSDESARTPH